MSFRPTPDRPALGVRLKRRGYQAYVRVGGKLLSQMFDLETPVSEMTAWRDRQMAKLVLGLPLTKDGPTLAEDCVKYLAAVKAMPTFSDREYRVKLWRDALGPGRHRPDITAADIRRVLQDWKIGGLSHASLNLRRSVLMHVWHVLDGKSAPNPVRDVPPFQQHAPALRLPTLADAERVVNDQRYYKKFVKTRARLRVLLWTGWPASQLMRLTKHDLKLDEGRALVRGRRKGAGTRDRWLPLLPQAVAALNAFDKAKAYGEFSTDSMRHILQRSCVRLGVAQFRPYDLRHIFASVVALTTKDDRIVSELLMHSDVRMARRYTESTVNERVKLGLEQVAVAVPMKADVVRKLPARKRLKKSA